MFLYFHLGPECFVSFPSLVETRNSPTNNCVPVMKKRTGVLLLVVLSLLAGCSLPFGGSGDDGQVTATEATPIDDAVETTARTTPTEAERTETSAAGPRYGTDTDTGAILLSLPELGAAYNFSSESVQRRSELSGSERTSFEEQGLLTRHERVFSLADGADGPPVVISTAAVYESADDAANASPALVESIQDAGGTAEQVELASGIEATRVSGETQTGRKNVLMTWQTDNLVIWVVTSGIEQSYPELAEEYFVEMVVDVP